MPRCSGFPRSHALPYGPLDVHFELHVWTHGRFGEAHQSSTCLSGNPEELRALKSGKGGPWRGIHPGRAFLSAPRVRGSADDRRYD